MSSNATCGTYKANVYSCRNDSTLYAVMHVACLQGQGQSVNCDTFTTDSVVGNFHCCQRNLLNKFGELGSLYKYGLVRVF